MKDYRKNYLRQVARRLRCPRQERERLLAGLKEELAGLPTGLSPAILSERMGTPMAVAAELESAVPLETIERHIRRRWLMTALGFVLCAAAIAWLIYQLAWVVSMFNGYFEEEIQVWS